MSHQSVNTEIGVISGRDAIYLDDVVQDYKHRTIVFSGEINSALASGYSGKEKWLKYSIKFTGVDCLSMTELDCYEYELEMLSSFDVLSKPRLKSRDRACKQFVFATYDHVFEVMAQDFDLAIEN